MVLLSKTLLAKWKWCFASEGDTFWKGFVGQKYKYYSSVVLVWKFVREEWTNFLQEHEFQG